MMKNPKLNRCTECDKIIPFKNKSGLCVYHCRKKIEKNNRLTKCHICEEPCSGKLLIEVRKGTVTSFCTYHFNILNQITDMKDVRKHIKYLKSYH